MKEFTHGLMVIVPPNLNVVHFVGFWEEPTVRDAMNLREELTNDPEFGLQDVIDKLVILPATDEVLKYYNDEIKENSIKYINNIESEQENK